MTNINRYRGNGLPLLENGKPFPYIADPDLVQVVNMAITLKRPLLVKGPPGCGKTRLAASVAHELGIDLNEWYVKSTSRAQDGLYSIDVIRRLQDAQLRDDRKAQRLTPYIRFGPLGNALKSNKESVVLIDEIDKADIDFPNDLLRELEEKKFNIEELDEDELTDVDIQLGLRKTFYSQNSPIIIITSNDEKELPDAFIRRCLFHHIEFPSREQLLDIVQVNTADLALNTKLIEYAVDCLNRIRASGDFRKQPATSELIDWVRILHFWGVDFQSLGDSNELADLPYWKVLFKNQKDIQQLERYSRGNIS